jgi:ketosteroid isomerase-like protein
MAPELLPGPATLEEARMRGARWALFLVAFSVVGAATARGQAAADPKRQIAALEDEWIKAVVRRDAMAFNRLLAPNFVYTEDDRVYTREQLIREITTSSDTVTGGRNEDLSVRLFGPQTAVVTGWLVLQGRGAGGPFTVRYRYTDTWVKFGGRWRVVAAHDYKKP